MTAGRLAGRGAFADRAVRLMALVGTIRGTMLTACAAIGLLTGGLGLYAAMSIREAGVLVTQTYDQSIISLTYAGEAGAALDGMAEATLRLRLEPDAAQRGELSRVIDSAAQAMADDLRVAAGRAQSPFAAVAASRVQAAADRLLDEVRHLPPSPRMYQLVDGAIAEARRQIEALSDLEAAEGFRQREAAAALVSRLNHLAIAGTVAALALVGVIGWVLTRRLIGPVVAASAAAARIAAGDMKAAIPRGGGDEMGQLLGAMTVMRDNIREMMEREVAQRRSAQAWLTEALENSGEGVILIDPDGRIALANTQALSLLSALSGLLQPGRPFALVSEAALLDGVLISSDGVGAPVDWLGAGWSGETESHLGDGRWLRVSRSFTGDGGSIAILNDLTALKAYQDALETANHRFAAALNHMSQGLVLFDGEDRLQVLNERFREIYRLPPGTPALGISFRALVELRVAAGAPSSRTAEAVFLEHAALIKGREPFTFFEEIPGFEGTPGFEDSTGPQTIAIAHVPIENGGWVATFEDITEQRRSIAQVRFMSRHDELTGLGNRATFIEQLGLVLAQLPDDRHVAVLHLDLDHFKPVNDMLGHSVGDRLLCAVAQRLQLCHGEADTAFRFGGDEFAIITAGIDGPEAAGELACRIIAGLAAAFAVGEHAIRLGISIGIAVGPRDGLTAEQLAEHADLAMNRAKTEDRGTYRFFEPEMNERLQIRRTLELDLRKAAPERQLELFFQPLVHLKQKRVSGFEALLRWRHPVRGMVSPLDFIPLAEELGLIVTIGEWVVEEACRIAVGWPDEIKVAVNVSPMQFRSPQLVQVVADALAQSGLAPDRLELEITESVLLDANDTTLATLRALKALGTRIAMDDFGTGYSSLSYLRSFPFDKIKIDQSFIRELQAGNNSGAIVDAITAMARSLDMRTVAEGVETMEQLQLVRAAGCTEAQGYLFSRPRPSGELAALLAGNPTAPLD